jgi:acetyltransferase
MPAAIHSRTKTSLEKSRCPAIVPLDAFFAPKTIAVIGASEKEGSVGRTLIQNLEPKFFNGAVYPVNPRHSAILDLKCYPAITALPEKIDLAVIATPARTVPRILSDCVRAGVSGAIIISAGFKESGAEGVALEKQTLVAADHKIRVIGPNCLGVMVPHTGLNATFASAMARPGNVGFISQSGALCTAILDWSLHEHVGFSAFISIGSMLDVGWGDLIYYLGDDPHTKSIVIYMESIGDARSFLSAAREVALIKPIIVIKVGRTKAGSQAAASHTGSLTGSDKVFDAALRRVGVLRVDTIEELFDMADVLSKQPRPKGPRLGIVTNAGGPGVIATDMLISSGGQLAELSGKSMDALNQNLPPGWSHRNPVDLLGDAGPPQYAKAVEIMSHDPNVDGLLVILTPQAMTDLTGTAEKLKSFARMDGKPILASWMGGSGVEAGKAALNAANIPTFDFPDSTARAFHYMWRYTYNLHGLYETPALTEQTGPGATKRVEVGRLIDRVRQSTRTLLSKVECNQILEAYGIPSIAASIATTEEQALGIAKEIGYPVVLKLYSETITHKAEVGGVKLNLCNATAVHHAWKEIRDSVTEKRGREHFLGVTVEPMVVARDGYELILGSSVDDQLGPVLLFGMGGQLVEVFRDYALALPPLNGTLARRVMEQTRIYAALKSLRDERSIHLQPLEQLLVSFSQLVAEQLWIKEIDINPLLVSPKRMVALDVRMILHESHVTRQQLPKPAIRPYPIQYVKFWRMKDRTPLTLRPIRPEDEPLMVKFHGTLSEQSVYYRYFEPLKFSERVTHERLAQICFNDYDREIALVAVHQNRSSGESEIVGVGRLSKMHWCNEAQFAIIISDEWQGRGLGKEFLKMLVQIGRDEKLDRITASILSSNHAMLRVSREAGFILRHDPGETECHAEFIL